MSAKPKSALIDDLDNIVNVHDGQARTRGNVESLLDSLEHTAFVNSGLTAATTLEEEGIHGVDVSGSAVTVTLGDAVTVEGAVVTVIDEQGNAATNNITVETESAQTIEGASSATISTNYAVAKFVSDGSNWFRV